MSQTTPYGLASSGYAPMQDAKIGVVMSGATPVNLPHNMFGIVPGLNRRYIGTEDVQYRATAKIAILSITEFICTMFTVVAFTLCLARGVTLGGTFDPLTNLTANLLLTFIACGAPVIFAMLFYNYQPTGNLALTIFEGWTGQYAVRETTMYGRLANTGIHMGARIFAQAVGWIVGAAIASRIMTLMGMAHTTIAVTAVGVYGTHQLIGLLWGMYVLVFIGKHLNERNTGKDDGLSAPLEHYGTISEIEAWQGAAARNAGFVALGFALASQIAGTHLVGTVNFWLALTQYVFGDYAAGKVVPFALLGTSLVASATAILVAWCFEFAYYLISPARAVATAGIGAKLH